MKFYNMKYPDDQVSFSYALIYGLGRNHGLFFPKDLPKFTDCEINDLLKMDFINRSAKILSVYINDEISQSQILKCVDSAFSFSLPVSSVDDDISVLELFHGPTLAFKDFGARFMAKMLFEVSKEISMIILTATSGDTGAAVAHAFYGMENIHVVILYPENKIPVFQEKMFCTLGKNIHTLSVDGDFDTCQLLVKQAFDDDFLRKSLCLNSANSMNICRLLAQICYFFEALAQLPFHLRDQVVISIPSGNFGNLTAGLFAKSLGLPIKYFIAATNINDTVPRFLSTGCWDPHVTIPTLSNAMDVSIPNNWERIIALFQYQNWRLSDLSYGSVNDLYTSESIRELFFNFGYLSEPHAAIAYYLLRKKLNVGEFGLFLGTAHPVKFKDIVEDIIGKDILTILVPEHLESCMMLPSLSVRMPASFNFLRNFLLNLIN